MKILVIGSGGREHALAWKLSRSPRVHKVFVAPGNPGTAREPDLATVAITAIPELIEFVRKEQIGLTVVGPEAPLAAGVVDAGLGGNLGDSAAHQAGADDAQHEFAGGGVQHGFIPR